MAARMKTGATYEDLVRLPENMIGELIDGELYASTRPPGPCLRFAAALGAYVGPPYDLGTDGPGGWWILNEPELHLGPDVLVPSRAGWRRERMPTVPKVFTVAPDWVCETRMDRRSKLPIYARAGVRYLWIAEPNKKRVELLQLIDGHWTLMGSYGGNVTFAAEPFPLAEVDLSVIWSAMPR